MHASSGLFLLMQRNLTRAHGHWRRWFMPARIALHVIAALALTLAAAGVVVAQPYFTRGVASGNAWDPLPYTDGNPMGVNVFLNEEPDPAVINRSLDTIVA